MKRIYKYEIGDGPGERCVLMPEGARVLSAQWQGRSLVAWAVVDDKASSMEEIHFRIVGTGHDCAFLDGVRSWSHVGTAQDPHGCVWHVFYLLRSIYWPSKKYRLDDPVS